MGKALSNKDPRPDLIVCSPAVRAKSTMEAAAKAAGYSCPIEFNKTIYEAADDELIQLVRAQPDTASTVLLVGHNPGFESLASRLTGKRIQMVTCTAACISFQATRWSDVEDRQGKLDWLLKPRDL
jgi:phosphohistidine phosphatase